MVSVATNFDAPIKLLWPRDIIEFILQSPEEARFTMLGLGDIVIPGIFVALCLRFDRHMSWKRNPTGSFRSLSFPKPYFTVNLLAYISGLALTMAVMHFFKAAQPALLYLSPACIISVLVTATVRGELKDLFAYTTEEEKDKKKPTVHEKIEIAEKEKVSTPSSISIEEIELEAEEEGDEREEGEIVEDLEDGEISKTTSRKKSNNNNRKRKNKK